MKFEYDEVKMDGTTAYLFLNGVEVAMVDTTIHPLEQKATAEQIPAVKPAKKKVKPAAE